MNSKQIIRKILFTAICAATSLTTLAANPKVTVRDVDFSLDTTKLVHPLGLEADYHKMMTDWYANQYLILDKNVDKVPSRELTDAEYIERLNNIQSDPKMEMTFNPIVKSYIKMYVDRRKGLVETMLGRSLYYNQIFDEALLRNNMPLELRNLAIIESALTPTAISKAGAAGLWQFMPSTGKSYGLEISSLVDERLDPYKSSEAAAKLLKKLYETYGDWSLAIAAYNCGPGNVNKALKRAGGSNKNFWDIYRFLPSETRDYVPAFIAATYAMTYYKEHGISPALAKEPIVTDTVWVRRNVKFKQISDVLGIEMEALRALNPQYKKDIIPGTAQKPYALILPNIQTLAYITLEDSITNRDAQKNARKVVASPVSSKTKDPNGEGYVDEMITIYHKVGKYDDVTSISALYGIPEADVVKANGGNKNLERGKELSFNIFNRSFMDGATLKKPAPTQPKPTDTNTNAAPRNDLASNTSGSASTQNSTSATSDVPKGTPKQTPIRPTPPPPAKKPTTNTTPTPVPPPANNNVAQQSSTQQPKATTAQTTKPQTAAQPKAKETAAVSPKTEQKQPVQQKNQPKTNNTQKATNNAQAANVGNKLKNNIAQAQTSNDAKSKKTDMKNQDPEKNRGKDNKNQVAQNNNKKDTKAADPKAKANDPKTKANDPKAKVAETAKAKANQLEKPKEQPKPAQQKPAQQKTSGPKVHETKSGDNLYNIAKKHGVTVDELKKANNLKSDKIDINQKLKIPAKKK